MTDNRTSAGKRVWITGAGSGIGRALAKRMGQLGWRVAVSARTASDLDTLAAELPPGVIQPVPLDVTDEAAVTAAVDAIEARLGPLDLAVFCAGTYRRVEATSFRVDRYRMMVEANLMGTVHCLAALMPRMIARRSGHLAVVSSLTGYIGLPSSAAYGATKAALINMCQSLEPELAVHGVGISVVNPGFVKTPLTDRNDFPMPFLIGVDEAVDHILRGLERKRFEIAFPWQLTLALRLLASLPHRLRLAITRRMVR